MESNKQADVESNNDKSKIAQMREEINRLLNELIHAQGQGQQTNNINMQNQKTN